MRKPLVVCHFSTSNMSVGNLSLSGEFLSHFYPKYLSAVAMATGVCRDERNVDCLVLCHNKQNRKISAKSVTMRATTLCKDLSGYRALLFSHYCLLIFDLDLHYFWKQLLITFFEIELPGKMFDMQ